jgi:Flp pilus assembly protein TadG
MKRNSHTRGNAMVEFALAVGLLLPMLFGTFEFGYAFYTYNRLIAAVREGARYASLRTYDSSTTTPSDTYLTAVKNAVVYGDPSGSGSPVVSGLTTDEIGVTMTMVIGVPDIVTVSVTNFTIDTIVKTLSLANKPSAAFRFEGTYAP